MAHSSFGARRAVLASFLVASAAAVLFAACGNTVSTAPPPGQGGFGDSGITPPHHDATTGPKDSGGGKDTGSDGVIASDGANTDALLPPDTPCTSASQCASHVCELVKLVGKEDGAAQFDAGLCETPNACQCQPPTCVDGVKNGLETDVDCGGSTCPACPVGEACKIGSDCTQAECGVGYAGGKCTGLSPDAGLDAALPADAAPDSAPDKCKCEIPSCSDGVKNEDETDVDCGGSRCAHCPTGKACLAATDCTSGICTANLCACPAGMTEAPTSTSVPYCIDTYEVTYEQYSMFVGEANANTLSTQPAECSWNKQFVPSDNWPQVALAAQNPVTFVNWCDALAYCSSLKKHLCGAIADPSTGRVAGAPITLASTAEFHDASVLQANDPAVDEWYNACSSQGQAPYPYGSTYRAGFCNGIDSPAQHRSGPVDQPPGSIGFVVDTPAASCILDTECGGDQYGVLSTVSQGQTVNCYVLGPTTGAVAACGPAFAEGSCVGGSSTNVIFDLSGNVAEWENSCDGSTGQNDNCAVRGGAYDTSPGSTTLTCASSSAQPPVTRSTATADIGFRCCL